MAYDKNEPTKITSSQQSPGGPQLPPSTWARVLRAIAAAAPATVGMAVTVVVVNALLPQPVKLTTLAGKFLAELNITETLTQQDVVVDNTRRMAEATAAANAKAQMEILAFQYQIQAATDAMQGKIAMANAADVTCTLGPLGIALFYGQNSYEARNAMQLVQAACAFAAQARQEIAAEQAQIVRLNSAIMERRHAAALAGMH